MTRKFKPGDQVYYYKFDGNKSEVRTVEGYPEDLNKEHLCPRGAVWLTNGTWLSEKKMHLVEENKMKNLRHGDKVHDVSVSEIVREEGWSQWECLDNIYQHPAYFKGYAFQAVVSDDSEGNRTKLFRVKLPKQVKVSELKGTVQMKPDGTPDWSTYKE